MIEAPRGGAGIEICRCRSQALELWKPLVEGLVLKFRKSHILASIIEAPRGGAGIEIPSDGLQVLASEKPLVEGLVLKSLLASS